MPREEQTSDQLEAAQASLQLAFKVIAQIGLLTLAVVMAAIFGGLWLDQAFSTRPIFTVILIVGSFPVSLYIIYRVALGAIGTMKTAAGQPRRTEEMRSDRDDDPDP
jgi:F0F1-type ATP synthase assembly protein I